MKQPARMYMENALRIALLSTSMFLASCMFGEGPDLLLDESDSETELTENLGQADNNNDIASDPPSANDNPEENNAGSETQQPEQSLEPEQPVERDQSVETEGQGGDAVDTVATIPADVTVQTSRVALIPRVDINNAPTIDGGIIDYKEGTSQLDGEWRNAVQADANGAQLAIDSLMFVDFVEANTTGFHHWAAMHDGNYLYLIVIVDDDGNHLFDTQEAGKRWKDDSIEVYIDGNYSRLNEYDGVDDFQITVSLLSDNAGNIAPAIVERSRQSAILPSDLNVTTGPGKGPVSRIDARGRTDIYEFRIKVSELNIVLGQPFGFEIQINDDDDGGSRDAKWGWQHPSGIESTNDLTWQNPSIMGTAILME